MAFHNSLSRLGHHIKMYRNNNAQNVGLTKQTVCNLVWDKGSWTFRISVLTVSLLVSTMFANMSLVLAFCLLIGVFIYLKYRVRQRTGRKSFHVLLLLPYGHNAPYWDRRKPGVLGSPMSSRCPGLWSIFCCFPKFLSRRQHHKQSGWDSTWHLRGVPASIMVCS